MPGIVAVPAHPDRRSVVAVVMRPVLAAMCVRGIARVVVLQILKSVTELAIDLANLERNEIQLPVVLVLALAPRRSN